MKSILIAAAVLTLSACSTMPGADPMKGGGTAPHDMAAMGDKDAMCAEHMKMMKDMQQKMSTKTPAERMAMMKEHMKMMPGGMGMPDAGKPPLNSGMGMKDTMLACRMDMMDMKMQMMMQMMVDRDAAMAPAVK